MLNGRILRLFRKPIARWLTAHEALPSPWWLLSRFVDEAVVVSDHDIRAPQRCLWEDLSLVVEPGGAAAACRVRRGRGSPGLA